MGNNIISSLGAGSGIDVSGLVDGLVAVEKAPLEGRLDSRQEKLEAQISAYGVLKSSLSEFQGVLKPLSEADTFNARSVSFPDSDVITPDKLEANAQVGAYQIEVLGVAQSQSLATAAISDTGAALGAGDITFRFGEWDSYTAPADPALGRPSGFAQNADKDALTISLDDDDSLQDLVRKINEADVDLQASIIQTDGQSQMLLTAPSGAKNAIQITAPDHAQFAFEDGVDSQLIQTQAAADATLQINGLDVSRESNNIDDVIPGLSFSVNKASAGDKITFSISEDSSTGEQAVRDFVEAYNSLYETLKNLTGTSTDAESEEVTVGGLSKDGSAKNMLSQIRQMMNSMVPGIDSGFSALSNIGIRTELDGTIEIIEDEFKDAIDNNFDQVASLFSPESSSSKSSLSVGYGSSIDKAV
ncbi:flagellar filament capping protein FliD, partial [Pontibacterium sp.]|uniref:flagellar filament capping protein FliD n=1 Tax=Pontibacterium sp. TaxID=2036026 RepID=UPI003569DF4F